MIKAMDEKLTARLRVISCTIRQDSTLDRSPGEKLEVKASGLWKSENGKDSYPVSVHLTVYPGCPAIPAIGDDIEVVIGLPSNPESAQSGQ